MDDTGGDAVDHDGATTCSMVSDEDVDQNMDSLDEVDCRILASVIMNVDVTEVFSPAGVNKLAAKFGLVPGASLDLTNGWDFSCAEDRIRAWKVIRKTVPYVIIGFPHVRCLAICGSLISTYIATILSGLRRPTRRRVRTHNMLSSALRCIGIS